MGKINFMKYLPPVRPKLVPKLKALKIYWNIAHLIFQICQTGFWCQIWFLWNIYHLLGPNWSQNEKCSGFIEIWHIWYFKYVHLDFNVKNDFYQICVLLDPNCSKNEKCSELIEIWLNLYFKYADLDLDVKNYFYYIFTTF